MLDGALEQAPWRLLAGPESLDADCSRLVCTCFGVSEERILQAIAAGASSAEDLGRRLECGTNCGSCVPELKALIAREESSTERAVRHAV